MVVDLRGGGGALHMLHTNPNSLMGGPWPLIQIGSEVGLDLGPGRTGSVRLNWAGSALSWRGGEGLTWAGFSFS